MTVCVCGWVESLHPREQCDGFREPRPWSIMVRGFGVRADTAEDARELALATVRDLLGGDTKAAGRALARLEHLIDVVPDESPRAPGIPLRPAALRWELDAERLT